MPSHPSPAAGESPCLAGPRWAFAALRAAPAGACSRCAAEVADGSRPQSQQCHAFWGAFEGASVCQTCGHSWHDHR